jgi:hypothetical protein
MAIARKRRWRRVLWSKQDVSTLRKQARRVPVATIAKQLKRSITAVRFKAVMLRVSLRMRK